MSNLFPQDWQAQMAHMRDSNGQPVRRGDKIVTITTEGETKERQRRDRIRQDQEMIRQENAANRAKRTNEQQLHALDVRLGENVGAKRERKRLRSSIG